MLGGMFCTAALGADDAGDAVHRVRFVPSGAGMGGSASPVGSAHSPCRQAGEGGLGDLRMCTGRSHNVRVEGVTLDAPSHPVFLELTLRANGALVHRQQEHLCRLHPVTAGSGDSDAWRAASAQRRCIHWSADGSSVPTAFDAETILYVPKNMPERRADATVNDALLLGTAESSAWEKATDATARQFPGQIKREDGKTLLHALATAVRTLPTPFTMLESGNLCGQSTVLLAEAKRHLCPRCRFVSLDPGHFRHHHKFAGHLPALRERYGANFSMQDCARLNVAGHGLSGEVEVIDAFGQEAPLTRPPIGFVFYDDGKVRVANAPQQAAFEPHLMGGAMLAFHDALDDTAPPCDQLEFMRELVSTQTYTHVIPPARCFSSAPGNVLGVDKRCAESMHLGTGVIQKELPTGSAGGAAGATLEAALVTASGKQLAWSAPVPLAS